MCVYVRTYIHAFIALSKHSAHSCCGAPKKKIKHCYGAPSGCAVSKAASKAAVKKRHQADATGDHDFCARTLVGPKKNQKKNHCVWRRSHPPCVAALLLLYCCFTCCFALLTGVAALLLLYCCFTCCVSLLTVVSHQADATGAHEFCRHIFARLLQ